MTAVAEPYSTKGIDTPLTFGILNFYILTLLGKNPGSATRHEWIQKHSVTYMSLSYKHDNW